MIEAPAARQELRRGAHVPLADAHGRVSSGLQYFCDSRRCKGDSGRIRRPKYCRHPDARRIRTSQKSSTGGRANIVSRVKMRKLDAFLRQAIQIGRSKGGSVGMKIAVTQIVTADYDKVGRFGRLRREGRSGKQSSSTSMEERTSGNCFLTHLNIYSCEWVSIQCRSFVSRESMKSRVKNSPCHFLSTSGRSLSAGKASSGAVYKSGIRNVRYSSVPNWTPKSMWPDGSTSNDRAVYTVPLIMNPASK